MSVIDKDFNVNVIRNETMMAKIANDDFRREKILSTYNEKTANFIKTRIMQESSKGKFYYEIDILDLIEGCKDEDFDFLLNKIREDFEGFSVRECRSNISVRKKIHISWEE